MEYNFKDTIFGIHPIEEALNSGIQIDKILIKKGSDSSPYRKIKAAAEDFKISIQEVPVEKLNRVTKGNHQGVIAFISPVEFQNILEVVPKIIDSGEDPFLIMLDRITDVKNFGAITRTAECAGVNGIIVPFKGFARIGSEALKGSAGALLHLDICKEHSLKQTIKFLKSTGIRVIACTEKTENIIYDCDLKGPIALLFGSEEDGISEELMRMCDATAKLPMKGKTSSLNVGAAVSAVCFEAVRQRI